MNATLTREDLDLVVMFAGCSLDEKPGSNWVQDEGGLPTYICEVARAIKRSGKSTSQAIAIAVSRIKKWAATGEADVKAKAVKALAQWEKLRSKAKAHKNKGDTVAASRVDGPEWVSFCATEFNTDIVRAAFEVKMREARRKRREQHRATTGSDDYALEPEPYFYVRELWTTYLIAEGDGYSGTGGKRDLVKIRYSVDPKTNEVTFGKPEKVHVHYVTDTDLGDDLSDQDLQALLATAGLGSAASRVVALARSQGMHQPRSGVAKFVDREPGTAQTRLSRVLNAAEELRLSGPSDDLADLLKK